MPERRVVIGRVRLGDALASVDTHRGTVRLTLADKDGIVTGVLDSGALTALRELLDRAAMPGQPGAEVPGE